MTCSSYLNNKQFVKIIPFEKEAHNETLRVVSCYCGTIRAPSE